MRHAIDNVPDAASSYTNDKRVRTRHSHTHTHAVCTAPPGGERGGERGLARKGWFINCSTVYRCEGSGQQQTAMNDLASGDICLKV